MQVHDAVPLNFGVTASKRGQPIGPVLFCIFVIAYANAGFIEKPDNRGHNFRLTESRKREIVVYTLADLRQNFAESRHAIELHFVSHLTILRVITVLLSCLGVSSHSLNMPSIQRTDPDIGPCRRDDERPDSP